MQFKILNKIIWQCRLTSVTLHPMKDGHQFVLAKFSKLDTLEFLFSYIYNERNYEALFNDMQTKRVHTIERLLIELQERSYHKLTWDDVDRGICQRDKIGEIQRNSEGRPLIYSQIVVFAHIDNRPFPDVKEILKEEYIDISSPSASKALAFNNIDSFHAKLEAKRRKEEMEQDDWEARAYEEYEEHKYDDMDLSKEEQIMRALKNGDGEYHGF